MSKACFGIDSLFAKEVRRRNKLERDAAQQAAIADGMSAYGGAIGDLKNELFDDEHSNEDSNFSSGGVVGSGFKVPMRSFYVKFYGICHQKKEP